jgi:hypothetical protein
VTTNPSNIFCAIEKFFGETTNYTKRSGSMYYDYMHTYNPKAHHYQIARALGGTRQDVGSEGAMAAFMDIPFFVEFLDWQLSCGTGDGILMKYLFIILQSVKMIALSRILPILHIAICILTRWLAGKTPELAAFRFGVRDMGQTVDLTEEAFEKIANDGEIMLDKDFMMNIFEPIVDQVEPFAEYLEFIFENKEGHVFGSREKANKWLPYDELHAELFFPTRNYVRQTHSIACHLAEVAAATFLIEFRDPKKATSDYLSSISGIRSWAMVSDEDKLVSQGKDATTSI